MSGHETDATTGLSEKAKFALVLSSGVVFPGLAATARSAVWCGSWATLALS